MSRRVGEHARIVLGAVLAGRRDLLEKAIQRLTPEHFPDQTLRNVFIVLGRYYDSTGAVVTRTAFGDLLARGGASEGTVALYSETFDQLCSLRPEDHEFAWGVKVLQEERATELTGRALASGLEALQGIGEVPEHLVDMPRSARARAILLEEFSRIDRELNMVDAPEGDVRHEAQDILTDYSARVAASRTGQTGIMFGLASLDAHTSGLQRGDLVLIAGYTSCGKSQLSTQLAWHTAVVAGRNVFFATSETVRSQVRRRLVSRHSRLPQFGLPDGLNSRDLKAGTLPQDLESKLREVVDDLTHNTSYGKLYVAQIPRGATIGMVEARLQAAQRSWNIDLVVIDYLALLAPERKRDSQWSEGSDLLKSAKSVATTFNDGLGVPIVSPWQVNRAAVERAAKTGAYMLQDLSETAEAEKSSDLIISLLRTSDVDTGRRVELRCQVLKNRDGELSDSIPLVADYATSYFAAPSSGVDLQSLLG